LILNSLTLLKISSFCYIAELVRFSGVSKQTCPQSYPQLLCATGRFKQLKIVCRFSHNSGNLSVRRRALFSIIQAAGWPIWPLIACSVIALALVIERFSSLQVRKVAPPKLIDEAITVSRTAVPAPDVVTQLEQNSLLGEVLASGFRALNAQPRISDADLRATIEGAGLQAAHKLERYLAALATIASAAPLIGLLGTVIGMIEIFNAQSSGGVAGGGSDPAQLARGISIALYNTAFGLIVAIPALIFWRYFRARVDGYLLTMELASERLLRHLNSLRKV